MAKSAAVWGIDIGNSSLKAMRCRQSDMSGRIEAVAFDFIEHSKILSQPGAEPAEILAETLQTFLSRNSTKGDQVAISVSGQNTISRFLKLPPVDPKKIPDIIKYEAKQWLPFDLDDVIWDFQPIGVVQSPTAVPMDSEIGMFAMKRDIAMKTLSPYLSSGINIDSIQSSPLAIYNFAAFDQLNVQSIEEYDPDNPPESIVVLCVGTDATDVVITNGFSIWIRSIPIGGNVFTKALTKGLKLTFSKAEYLKRNAAAAQDPKAVFQAMRPVFNDMLSEVHRSLEYYQSLNRKVKFSKILALGNAMKMPGLRQFLTQNLGYEVTRLNQFNRLVGPDVIEAPLFKENLFSFGVCYGLAIQQLGDASLTTNLIPKEIVTDRIVREKKPWVLTASAAVMLGLVLQFTGASRALETVSTGDYGRAEEQAKTVSAYSAKMKSETQAAVDVFNEIDNIGKNLTSNVEGRITWLELLRAINASLPVETKKLDGKNADEVSQQNRLFVSNVEAITVDDLATWFAPLKEFNRYYPDDEELLEIQAQAEADGGEVPGTMGDAPTEGAAPIAAPGKRPPLPRNLSERLAMIPGPAEGTIGRVVQVVGYHYHNAGIAGDDRMGSGYVRATLLRKLKFGEVILPPTLEKQIKETGQMAKEVVSMRDLGISYPTLMDIPKTIQAEIVNPRVILEMYLEERREMLQRQRGTGGRGGFGGGGFGGGGFGGGGEMSGGRSRGGMEAFGTHMANPSFGRRGESGPGGGHGREGSMADYVAEIAKKIDAKDKILLRRFDFVVQFAWVETPPSMREKKKEEERLAALAKRAEAEGTTSVLQGEVTNVETPEEPEPVEPTTPMETPAPAEPSAPVETPVPTPVEPPAPAETPAPASASGGNP